MSGRKINTTFLHPHRAPSKIVCLAYNYWSLKRGDIFSSSSNDGPLIFLKPDTSIIGPKEHIILKGHTNYAWPEVELAVVCQGVIYNPVTPEEAEKFIGGYRVANDVSSMGTPDVHLAQFKGQDTFCPIGDTLVQNIDTSDLEMATEINGKLVQKGRTSDIIYAPAEAISLISEYMTLVPGDIILTGTPYHERPQLHNGDKVTVWIDGIGELTNYVERQ